MDCEIPFLLVVISKFLSPINMPGLAMCLHPANCWAHLYELRFRYVLIPKTFILDYVIKISSSLKSVASLKMSSYPACNGNVVSGFLFIFI